MSDLQNEDRKKACDVLSKALTSCDIEHNENWIPQNLGDGWDWKSKKLLLGISYFESFKKWLKGISGMKRLFVIIDGAVKVVAIVIIILILFGMFSACIYVAFKYSSKR